MNRVRLVILLVVCFYIGTACGGSPKVSPPASSGENDFNILVVVEGKVQLKREQWTEFHPTSFGAMLYRGDQIQPASGAKVVVLCNNLASWNVPAGAPSGLNNGCPQDSEPVLVRSSGLIGNTRGGTDPLLPFIISPRATRLIDPNPNLRWNPVPGVNSYTVSIRGIEWKETVNTSEFTYPGDPPLKSVTEYLLIVEAENGTSSRNEGTPGLGFSLLSGEEIQQVQADLEKIDSLELAEPAKSFAIAQLYASRELYAEAIQLLEKVAKNDGHASNLHRALGELYQKVGLTGSAELSYQTALELAEHADDLESLSAVQNRLGEIYLSRGLEDEAVRWLEEARAGYERLGDRQQVEQITAELQKLTQ